MRLNASAPGRLKEVNCARAVSVLRATAESVNAFVCSFWVSFGYVGITSVLRRYHVGARIGFLPVWQP